MGTGILSPPTNDTTTFSPGPSPNGERELALEIAKDVVSLLVEIVTDADDDSSLLIRHLVDHLGGPGAVDVGYIGPPGSIPYGFLQIASELPPVNGTEGSLVLLVEPDLIADLIEDTWSAPGGGVDLEALQAACDRAPDIHRLTSCGLLADLVGALRRLCETTGLKVVLITVDDRPDHGRPGTIVWQREAPAPAWDVDELLDSLTVEDADEAVEVEKGLGDEFLEINAQIAVGDDDPAKNGGLDPRLELMRVLRLSGQA